LKDPTAQALLAEVAVTPDREDPAPGPSLVTRVQAAPFQCMIMVWDELLPSSPTAQALQGDSTATPLRKLLSGLGLGGWAPVSDTHGAELAMAGPAGHRRLDQRRASRPCQYLRSTPDHDYLLLDSMPAQSTRRA
jgi:hypothetical protein